MKEIVKKILPAKIISCLKVLLSIFTFSHNYLYDLSRYWKYSGTFNKNSSKAKNEGNIIFLYHSIEKGLSLPNPRIGFGKERVNNLVKELERTHKLYGPNETTEVALNALYAYYEFNTNNGWKDNNLEIRLDNLKKDFKQHFTDDGGTIQTGQKEIYEYAKIDNFDKFLNCRYSIRNFGNGKVDIKDIETAVNMARKTPSVCNRQSAKVHVYADKSALESVLKYQNGNRGFGNTADKVLIVTSDLSVFHHVFERNQAYIDGGLFSMSLVYALHSLGIGSCCLNCSNDYRTDKQLRVAADLNNSETPIMMIVVGVIPKSLNVAQSHRKKLKDIMTIH